VNEPDVALTNFVIVVQCLSFAWSCARRPPSVLRDAFTAFFAASALGSGLAGVVHGFVPDPDDPGHAALWTLTMLALVAAAAFLGIAASEFWSTPAAERALRLRVIAIAAICLGALIVLGARDFMLAVLVYVPASIWLALSFVRRWLRRRSVPLLIGAAGLALAILAGALQQVRYTPVPDLLSYNAWYHVLQISAFAALFVGCNEVLAIPEGESTHA